MHGMEPWQLAAIYSHCGQTFFTPESKTAHEDICGYCVRENERLSK